jgi:AraC-like DNA-binding protein
VDHLVSTLGDGRVVAHLARDEPPENARIVTAMYLADETKGRCRQLTPQDLELTRHATPPPPSTGGTAPPPTPLRDAEGHLYRIREVAGDRSVPELRWTRSRHPDREDPFASLTLRDVVARLEDYEPARTITTDTLAVYRHDHRPSTRRLREELERLTGSSIVLNRRLREVVQRVVARGEVSMSEIAMRCGRIKRDRRGNPSGETSWLARRIGRLPEGGKDEPTPWIHSDVLALIVRAGLGASPHEVEL